MEPKKQHVSAFTVSGITVRTINSDEMNPMQAKLGKHWNRFFTENLMEKIPHRQPNTPVYGVYTNYESDYNGQYDLTAGVAVTQQNQDTTFTQIKVVEGDYLVFEGKGLLPQSVMSAWYAVWQYFQANPQIKRAYTTDFEAYSSPTEVAVYIALESTNAAK